MLPSNSEYTDWNVFWLDILFVTVLDLLCSSSCRLYLTKCQYIFSGFQTIFQVALSSIINSDTFTFDDSGGDLIGWAGEHSTPSQKTRPIISWLDSKNSWILCSQGGFWWTCCVQWYWKQDISTALLQLTEDVLFIGFMQKAFMRLFVCSVHLNEYKIMKWHSQDIYNLLKAKVWAVLYFLCLGRNVVFQSVQCQISILTFTLIKVTLRCISSLSLSLPPAVSNTHKHICIILNFSSTSTVWWFF